MSERRDEGWRQRPPHPAFARPVMQAEQRTIAEQVVRVVQEASLRLPFSEEE